MSKASCWDKMSAVLNLNRIYEKEENWPEVL